MSKKTQKILTGVFVVFAVAVLVIANVFFSSITTVQSWVFAGLFSLGIGGAFIMMWGFLGTQIPLFVRIGVAVVGAGLLFIYSPVQLVTFPIDYVVRSRIEDHGFTVSPLNELKSISHHDCTDETLQKVAGILEDYGRIDLDLSESAKLTDKGIGHLQPLNNVVSANFSKTNLTSDVLPTLKAWTGLKSLILSDSKVDNNGWQQLSPLKKLKALWLDGTAFSNEGVGNIGDLNITELNLSRTAISDEGIAKLVELPVAKKITVLMLNKTQITDKSLRSMKSMKQLNELWIKGLDDGISDGAVAELEEAVGEDLEVNR